MSHSKKGLQVGFSKDPRHSLTPSASVLIVSDISGVEKSLSRGRFKSLNSGPKCFRSRGWRRGGLQWTFTSCLKRQTRTQESPRALALWVEALSRHALLSSPGTVTELAVSTAPAWHEKATGGDVRPLAHELQGRAAPETSVSSATRPASPQALPGWRRQDERLTAALSGLGPSAIGLLCVHYFYFVTQLNLFAGKNRNLELLQVLGGGQRLESAVDSARAPAGLGGARAGERTFFRSAILQNPRD